MSLLEQVDFRSDCAISSALDIIGDKWSLLIIRDIVLHEKSTYKEFNIGQENISSSVLAGRLVKLEEMGVLVKLPHPTNKKVFEYYLTEMGADLIPVLTELVLWSGKHLQHHISNEAKKMVKMIVDRKEEVQTELRDRLTIK